MRKFLRSVSCWSKEVGSGEGHLSLLVIFKTLVNLIHEAGGDTSSRLRRDQYSNRGVLSCIEHPPGRKLFMSRPQCYYQLRCVALLYVLFAVQHLRTFLHVPAGHFMCRMMNCPKDSLRRKYIY